MVQLVVAAGCRRQAAYVLLSRYAGRSAATAPSGLDRESCRRRRQAGRGWNSAYGCRGRGGLRRGAEQQGGKSLRRRASTGAAGSSRRTCPASRSGARTVPLISSRGEAKLPSSALTLWARTESLCQVTVSPASTSTCGDREGRVVDRHGRAASVVHVRESRRRGAGRRAARSKRSARRIAATISMTTNRRPGSFRDLWGGLPVPLAGGIRTMHPRTRHTPSPDALDSTVALPFGCAVTTFKGAPLMASFRTAAVASAAVASPRACGRAGQDKRPMYAGPPAATAQEARRGEHRQRLLPVEADGERRRFRCPSCPAGFHTVEPAEEGRRAAFTVRPDRARRSPAPSTRRAPRSGSTASPRLSSTPRFALVRPAAST